MRERWELRNMLENLSLPGVEEMVRHSAVKERLQADCPGVVIIGTDKQASLAGKVSVASGGRARIVVVEARESVAREVRLLRLKRVEVVEGRFPDKKPGGGQSLVFCNNLLHLVGKSDRRKIIKASMALLRPDGVFIARTPIGMGKGVEEVMIDSGFSCKKRNIVGWRVLSWSTIFVLTKGLDRE